MAAAALKATGGKVVLSDSDEAVQTWIKTRGGELISGLSEESRRAVMNIILRGQALAEDPRRLAQEIRPLIGLNQRQAQANVTYRERVYQRFIERGLSPSKAAEKSDAAALRYAGKQHRYRAETIVNTEMAFAYNRGAHMGVCQAIANGYMGRCEMVWSTVGTNRVCSRCMELRGRVVGTTEDSGVTIPPLHPRCRCTIMYQEVEPARALRPNKPKPSIMDIAPLVAIPVITEPTNPTDFDIQRFGGQKLPEGNYNLTVRRQVQNRHIEGTKEYQDYEERLSNVGFKPSKLLPETDVQKLVYEFHGKGIYNPNPKDDSPREQVDIGKIIGQYWDTDKNQYIDTTWIKIVYSKRGTHIYPIRPIEEE